MATVSVQAVGGRLQIKEAATVGELKAQLGLSSYSATINNEPAENNEALSDNDFVSLAPQVKGA